MNDYLLLMHDDLPPDRARDSEAAWAAYLGTLRASGRFDGGSAIGGGIALRRDGAPAAVTAHLGGYLRLRAESLQDAQRFLAGNPVFEQGGTVEIRELPRD